MCKTWHALNYVMCKYACWGHKNTAVGLWFQHVPQALPWLLACWSCSFGSMSKCWLTHKRSACKLWSIPPRLPPLEPLCQPGNIIHHSIWNVLGPCRSLSVNAKSHTSGLTWAPKSTKHVTQHETLKHASVIQALMCDKWLLWWIMHLAAGS